MLYTHISLFLLFALSVVFLVIMGKATFLYKASHLFMILPISMLNIILLIYFGKNNLPVPVMLTFVYFIILPECILIYRKQIRALSWGVLMFTFYLICARGISISIYSIITGSTVYSTMHFAYDRGFSTIFTVIILLLFAPIFFKMYPAKSLQHIVHMHLQYNMIVAVESVMILYLMFLNLSYYFDISVPGFAPFYLVSIFIFLAAHFIVLTRTLRESIWVDEELKGKILAQQLERQIAHYKAYQKHVEGYLEFKQAYNAATGVLRNMILSKNYFAAIEMMQNSDEGLAQLQKQEELCNHPLVDAILQDYARFCGEHNISFNIKLFIPDWFALSDLEYCKLFSNILDNACESCLSCPQSSQTHINLSSNISSGWLNIIQTNSLHHSLKAKDGILLTTKSDIHRHGLGTKIIKEIAEKHRGFIEFEPDTEHSSFSLKLHFPPPNNK